MSKTLLVTCLSIVGVAALLFMLSGNEARHKATLRVGVTTHGTGAGEQSSSTSEKRETGPEGAIHLFCAASNQAVIEEIRKEYEKETGRKVVVQYGNSQSILSQIAITKTGDLFLPADDSYLDLANRDGLIAETIPVAVMRCGLVVKKGNPHGIKSLNDLLTKKVRFVQASPEATAVGKLAQNTFEGLGVWDEVQEKTLAYRTTITEVANDIRIDAADVGIVYDAVIAPYDELEFVPIDELVNAASQISISVLNSTVNSARALHFARYVTASDRGLLRYQQFGFQVESGDKWEDVPELSVFAGSMLRPAIENSIVEFEKREGVQVSRVYNGCGILVAQMKSGQQPDAYFACDLEFMAQVKNLFDDSVNVSQNQLVILVPKGNPKNIGSLRDLTKPGLRVGIGHEKQCAMGWITQNTFRESGLQTELMENVKVQTPTGDMLVNQLRTESLDAAVAYLSNAAGSADFLDAIEIVGIPCSTAVQPWAVAKNSPYPRLADRLFAKISSIESKETFEAEGFVWNIEAESSQNDGQR